MNEKAKAAIEVEDLTVAYHHNPVLWDIDLTIPEGVICAIVGPNGAGKSTLLKAILDLIPVSSGSVEFYGKSLKQMRREVAYVPQRSEVDWDFPTTVLDVVMMGSYGKLGWIKKPGRAEREAAFVALKKVGMTEFADRQISELSGGQKQRTFIARALVQDASLLLMDEPFAGVDAATEQAILAVLRELQQQGKTLVIVHHDLLTVKAYFDHVVLLNVHTVADGPVKTTFTDENLEKAFKGKFKAMQGRIDDLTS
ncbi:MAG TPA: metal ABC transporter ATP-binding protein [Sphaerochaeta sp.]|nr:metal ABC transporter ATP-binding protein [Sphaerochaeta sp.]